MTAFLDHVWPELPEGWLLVWTIDPKGGKISRWYRDKAEATAYALSCTDSEVYIGVGLRPDPESIGPSPAHVRGKSSDILAMPGFVADLDCAWSGGKKQEPFKTKDKAREFLSRLPLEPSLVVDSGGGLQAWWLFREPWIFDGQDDRDRAERLAGGWTAYLKQRATEAGARDAVDSVWDLSRVLRFPGTWNHKARKAREARLLETSDRRFNPSDFEPWQLETTPSTELRSVDSVIVRASAEPPYDKLHALMEIDPEFRATWERKRKRMGAKDDHSKSGYDMAIAARLALAGWGAQEITDALIAWRRVHGLELRLREDYYQRTVAKALAHRDQLEAVDALEHEELAPGDTDSFVQIILGTTGVPVSRIVSHGQMLDGAYTVVLNGTERRERVGTLTQLIDFATWRKLAFVHGQVVARPSAKRWDVCVRAIQRLVEVQPAEDTEEGEVLLTWLRRAGAGAFAYPEAGKERAVVLQSGQPFYRDGRIYLRLEKVMEVLRFDFRERIRQADVVARLRAAGWEAAPEQAHDGERNVKRWYWSADAGVLT